MAVMNVCALCHGVPVYEHTAPFPCSRVGFYVNTFKNVTNLESKFHREISMVSRETTDLERVIFLRIYEVE